MSIQERLRRANITMLVVPIVLAGILLVVGLGAAVLLLGLEGRVAMANLSKCVKR